MIEQSKEVTFINSTYPAEYKDKIVLVSNQN
jgi:hypothetical protein